MIQMAKLKFKIIENQRFHSEHGKVQVLSFKKNGKEQVAQRPRSEYVPGGHG